MIIVDIQGVLKDKVLTITDPAIHSDQFPDKFGITNNRLLGMTKFFRTHKCNKYCKKLYLIHQDTIPKEDIQSIVNSKTNRLLRKEESSRIAKLQSNIRKFDPSKSVIS